MINLENVIIRFIIMQQHQHQFSALLLSKPTEQPVFAVLPPQCVRLELHKLGRAGSLLATLLRLSVLIGGA